MLWDGRSLVSSTWPPGNASTERWFFDKVGAARGYSGNGIWEASDIAGNVVSHIHLSFYGIDGDTVTEDYWANRPMEGFDLP